MLGMKHICEQAVIKAIKPSKHELLQNPFVIKYATSSPS